MGWTQIAIPDEEAQKLEELSARLGESKSGLVCKAIKQIFILTTPEGMADDCAKMVAATIDEYGVEIPNLTALVRVSVKRQLKKGISAQMQNLMGAAISEAIEKIEKV